MSGNKVVWLEGDVNFAETVRQLQETGELPKTVFTLPLPYLSVSQVEMYLRCPTQFKFRYIEGKKRPPSVAMVQGTTIHRTVEVGYKHVMLKGDSPSLESALDTYSGEIDKNMAGELVWDAPEEDEIPEDKGAVKDQGVKLIRAWHLNKLPKVHPRAVERNFITLAGDIPVVGKIDLVDRVDTPLNLEDNNVPGFHPLLDTIVDNKITGKRYAQTAANSKLQMSIYAHATGIPRQRYDLFIKTKTPKIDEMLTSRNAQEVRWAVKTFIEVARAISAGVFPMCSPESFMCNQKWCGYWGICRGAV